MFTTCTQYRQIRFYYPQMCTTCIQHPRIRSTYPKMTSIPSNVHNLHSTSSNQVFFLSNDQNTLKCAHLHFTTLIRPSYTQMTFDTLKIYTSALNQIKSTLTISNMHLYTFNAPISKPPTSKHQPMLQTCTNAPPTRNTQIALMSTKTLKIHSFTNKQSKL
jgi:hypothetical protein